MILFADLSSGASGDKLLAALMGIAESQGLMSFPELQDTMSQLIPSTQMERVDVERSHVCAPHIEVTDAHPQPQRSWHDIAALIRRAPISDGARERAYHAFERIAQAEAEAHGVDVDEVHFHEVGATDSIADIVGVSILLDALNPDAFICTPMALGFGSVQCAHGILPVPAPATAAIVEGVPVYAGAIEGELTTPTGASLIVCNATSFEPLPLCTPLCTCLGAGSNDFEGMANVVRIIAADEPRGSLRLEQVTLLESNVDHISPENSAFAVRELLDAGALDVWQTPITMKKGRLAIMLSVLCLPKDADRLAKQAHRLTGTLGIRRRSLVRSVLERELCTLNTRFGQVGYKTASLDEGEDTEFAQHWVRPEADDVARIAHERELPYAEVETYLIRLGEEELAQDGSR